MISRDQAAKSIESFTNARILVIGDVMLDHFIWGNVRRISPEAPVPVVEVTKEDWYPGGAANVARNISPFTSHVHLMGRVGDDTQAQMLRSLLEEDGVDPNPLLINASVPTISKARVAARQQQIVRVDRETHLALTSSELEDVRSRLRAIAPDLDAVIIEDYGKGFVTQELADVVAEIAAEFSLVVTVDPSPRNPISWRGMTWVKPNRSEAFAAAGIEDRSLTVPPAMNEEILRVGAVLQGKWDAQCILITLGEQGMMLFQRGEEPHHIPTRAREVYDVSGAGDTAIALLTLSLAAGLGATAAADLANHASGIVVGKLGTAQVTPKELLTAFDSY